MPPTKLDHNNLPRTQYVHAYKQGGYYARLPALLGRTTKYFGLKKYGGTEGAYEAAIAWRDQNLAAHQATRHLLNTQLNPLIRRVRQSKKTSLGRIGIEMRHFDAKQQPDGQPASVRASIRVPGIRSAKTRTFSINRYGIKTALRYALRQRLAWEREYYGHYSRVSEDDWFRFVWLVYQQHGTEKIRLQDIAHPGSISHPGSIGIQSTSYPENAGVQAYITIRNMQYSEHFPYAQFESRHEACVAAILWCIRTKASTNQGPTPSAFAYRSD